MIPPNATLVAREETIRTNRRLVVTTPGHLDDIPLMGALPGVPSIHGGQKTIGSPSVCALLMLVGTADLHEQKSVRWTARSAPLVLNSAR